MSPPYDAVTDPEPPVVPVKVTKQLPAVRVQVVESNDPPVVPALRVKVTVPLGVFAALVVSVTVAVTGAEQFVPLSAIVQLTLPTLVEVLSFDVAVTVTIAEPLALPLWVESPP